MATATSLKDRFEQVKARVAEAAIRSGRSPGDVILVAVTKHATPEQVRELVNLGHQDFGENRVQQLVQRAAMMEEYLQRRRALPGVTAEHEASLAGVGKAPTPPDSVRWHMIGRLQRNKAKKAIDYARLIHSVESLRLAEDLQSIALRKDLHRPIDVLLQVNCSGETTKQGVALAAAKHVADQIDTMVQLRLRGLMTMAPLDATGQELRDCFKRTKSCFDDIVKRGVADGRFNLLSMGMSNDFEIAIEEGANIVRVGSAIFGEPEHADREDEQFEDDEY
ncbi:MAG: YggS family pyridoxal phosphate-dependent enzyme [Phycisphaeraceae bacterium]|nr:YggS family pyridoxal phosphate-dependent enzyme [Phycisphaeraceae bacterium]MCB9847721.1 YggS family pyridoxal phosphate-dependent enzyme [Phycisphaeraceae bacterium]